MSREHQIAYNCNLDHETTAHLQTPFITAASEKSLNNVITYRNAEDVDSINNNNNNNNNYYYYYYYNYYYYYYYYKLFIIGNSITYTINITRN